MTSVPFVESIRVDSVPVDTFLADFEDRVRPEPGHASHRPVLELIFIGVGALLLTIAIAYAAFH